MMGYEFDKILDAVLKVLVLFNAFKRTKDILFLT